MFGARTRRLTDAAMTFTDMVLLVCVTGTVLLAAVIMAGVVFGWAVRWWR